MRRRLFTLAAVASAVLLAGVVGLWVRSYFVADLAGAMVGGKIGGASVRGVVVLFYDPSGTWPPDWRWWYVTTADPVHFSPLNPWMPTCGANRRGGYLTVPCWCLAVVLLPLPLLRSWPRRRAKRAAFPVTTSAGQ